MILGMLYFAFFVFFAVSFGPLYGVAFSRHRAETKDRAETQVIRLFPDVYR